MEDKLKCQFCVQTFDSTYKFIPHVYFGHRKKVFKRATKKDSNFMFNCPGGCETKFPVSKHFVPGSDSDAMVHSLAVSLVPLEDHLNTHTKETKVVSCEYCQLPLHNIIFWEHLAMHMKGELAPSPEKTEPVQSSAGEAGEVKIGTVDASLPANPKQLTIAVPDAKETPSAFEVKSENTKPAEEVSTSGQSTNQLTKEDSVSSQSAGVISAPPTSDQALSENRQRRPSSPLLTTVKPPSELAASTIPFSSFFKKHEIAPPQPPPPPSPSNAKAVEEPPRVEPSPPPLSSSHSLSEPEALKVVEPAALPEHPKPIAPVQSAPVKPSRRGSSDKQKISLSEYSKIRKLSGDKLKKDAKAAETSTKCDTEVRRSPSEGREVRPLTPDEKKPSPPVSAVKNERDVLSSLQKDRQFSGDPVAADQKTDRKSPRLRLQISPDVEKDIIKGNRVYGGKGSDSMRPPTPLDRPVTPSVPPSPDGPASSRSTTPGDKMSRPTTPLDRPPSASRRPSSDHKTRRLSGGFPKDKPKPVITEEMERQIIFGGALLKGKGLLSKSEESLSSKSEDITSPVDPAKKTKETPPALQKVSPTTPPPKVSQTTPPPSKVSPTTPPSSKVSPTTETPEVQEEEEKEKELTDAEKKAIEDKRRREKWLQEEKEKRSRESALADIRKQIELRFQQEELERMKDKEAERKRQEEFREKIRVEEEKLRKEKEKIAAEKRRQKQRKKEAKRSRDRRRDPGIEVFDLEVEEEKEEHKSDKGTEEGEEAVVEEVEDKARPPLAREKSPDQYELLKLNFLSQRKQALEDELRMLNSLESKSQPNSRSRSSSPVKSITGSRPDTPLAKSRSQTPAKSRGSTPPKSRSRSPGQETGARQSMEPEPMEVDNQQLDAEEDEDDDLEAMMRKYKEKEQEEEEEGPVNSLSLLRDSYGGETTRKRTRSASKSPQPVETEDISKSPIQEDAGYAWTHDAQPQSDIDGGDHVEVIQDEPEEVAVEEYDEYGHPVNAPRVTNSRKDERKQRAAKSAAMDIMAPAKQSRGLKAARELQCSLCKEDGAGGSYYSAYQLLSHVFLVHRKKLTSRSRRVRGMTLACPEGCGFITNMSSDGSSIDYFQNELPKHLDMLCDHIRDIHTGEPEMDHCQYCSQPLKRNQSWSWQHLANHIDERRFFCDICNNFPFRTEVHKCPGSGLETHYVDQDEKPEPARKRQRVSEKDVSKTKSLEELAREVETGNLDMEKLVKRKNLGNLERFICEVCDKCLPCLSQWLVHIRLDHLARGHIKRSRNLRCFCCSWEPPRFENGREIIGVNNLVNHLVESHHSEEWQDSDFEVERNKLLQIQRDMERRLEREREESGIVVPKLPSNCNTCNIAIISPKTWRYHVLAHKFGEVFCSSCRTCILGHHFQEHRATCNEDDTKVKVKIENFRGETWLNNQGKKFKVNFDYDESEEVGSITIARTIINGSRVVRGHGGSHDEATRALRDEIQNILTAAKIKDEEERKDELMREDKEKLLNLFRQLAAVDKENAGVEYALEVESKELSVQTKLHYTRAGKCKIEATTVYKEEKVAALGDNRSNAVSNLAAKIRILHRQKT